MDTEQVLDRARRCFRLEIDALEKTCASLDESFARVVAKLQAAQNSGHKTIFSGIGKNAPICQKLVGTFNSIGSPACFLDPVNALHGDMGLCRQGDVLIALSNKGETVELLRLLPIVKRFELFTVGITSAPNSSLAKLCDETLVYRIDKEACPLDLAPTASTTASIAMGDALAMVLLESRSFRREDFARFHPGGSIGQALSPRVEEIMRSGSRFPTLPLSASCQDCLHAMTEASCGCVAITEESGQLAGIITDGDVRRIVLNHANFLNLPASAVMTRRPIVVPAGSLAVEALRIFERSHIDDLIVVDDQQIALGVIDGQDLTKVRVI